MSKVDAGNDGQHRGHSFYNPGKESGMKSVIDEAARVGQRNGPELNMSVPKAARDCMIDTTTKSAGPRAVGEITHGDDK